MENYKLKNYVNRIKVAFEAGDETLIEKIKQEGNDALSSYLDESDKECLKIKGLEVYQQLLTAVSDLNTELAKK